MPLEERPLYLDWRQRGENVRYDEVLKQPFAALENYFHKYLSEYNTRADRVKRSCNILPNDISQKKPPTAIINILQDFSSISCYTWKEGRRSWIKKTTKHEHSDSRRANYHKVYRTINRYQLALNAYDD
jgi:hypothetical protein